ncbi:hypothetical protein HPB49_004598 [Dermacentor silvarum]|uniref:Uncharacterized protein n=1 Tax=Dermacentor silvarum TaxID=543639 RepID=A0ACB8CV68_DERSI|nr:hypothetical protein HPB49_004598 [Dermacentor silvarum]
MATNDGTEINLEHTQIPLTDEADGGDWLTVKYGRKKTSTPTNPPLQPRHPSVSQVERLPPLPRNDLKVIIRPREGLNLATWTTPQVAEGIKMACQHPTNEHVRTLTVRIDPVQNIAIASTPNEELAMSIRHINTIHLGGREFAVTAYVAAPDSSAKGVIHGIPAGTPTEVLLNGLYAPGREILHARMLGQTSAAVITFTGKTVPFYVRYYSGEVRCKPYRPTTHVCRICHQVGHRTDVCPTPEVNVCPQCGTQNPTQDHPCHPRCALCQGSHPTASKECPDRLKKTPLASQRTSRHEHSRSRSRSRPCQRRKRSGSRSCSCTRNQQGATRNPSGPAPPGSQTVSWSARLFPSHRAPQNNTLSPHLHPVPTPHISFPKDNTDIQQQILAELKAIREENKRLHEENKNFARTLQNYTPVVPPVRSPHQ